MKYFNNPLFCLAVLVAVVGIPAAVVHSIVDKSVDKVEDIGHVSVVTGIDGDQLTVKEYPFNLKNEQVSPTPNAEVQASQAPKESDGTINVRPQGKGGGSQGDEGVDASKPGCGEEDAAKAGWKVLSCEPLRVMPLEEWNQKSASPNFRWRPDLYCFDESNFAGIFHEVPLVDFPDPNWLSEVKLENGCSFFFHPNQGQGNGAPDERE